MTDLEGLEFPSIEGAVQTSSNTQTSADSLPVIIWGFCELADNCCPVLSECGCVVRFPKWLATVFHIAPGHLN